MCTVPYCSVPQLGSGKHGDAMRLLAGGGSAANQIEYTNKYGSALPVFFTGMPLSPSPPVGEKEQSSAAGTLGGDGERDEVGRAQERCDVADSLATPRF